MIGGFLRSLFSIFKRNTSTMTDARSIDVAAADLIGAKAAHATAKQNLTLAQEAEKAAADAFHKLEAEVHSIATAMGAEVGRVVAKVEGAAEAVVNEVKAVI